ncbi:unnamed protein product [Caenorhabditis auriculariae]|uniref:Uncharacterized protein n=1 Tax=Caenorhabditis auriculariae TaxID=2777116 RepID=A0A8S1HD13_9PELO|nr:unnamed protein product [Caenorhabditis auriculariae]
MSSWSGEKQVALSRSHRELTEKLTLALTHTLALSVILVGGKQRNRDGGRREEVGDKIALTTRKKKRAQTVGDIVRIERMGVVVDDVAKRYPLPPNLPRGFRGQRSSTFVINDGEQELGK